MKRQDDELKKRIYDFIADSLRKEGIPPTVREICRYCGIKSTSTAYQYINRLAEEGLIEKPAGKKRAITLPSATMQSGVSYVPLVGKVAAGTPILAIENIDGYIPFSGGYDSGELFALTVSGDSMIEIGMYDGDTIICKQASTAYNGEIVVALVDDSATVKRFYKENGHFRLQPENSSMEPIIVDSVSILGKVIAQIRFY